MVCVCVFFLFFQSSLALWMIFLYYYGYLSSQSNGFFYFWLFYLVAVAPILYFRYSMNLNKQHKFINFQLKSKIYGFYMRYNFNKQIQMMRFLVRVNTLNNKTEWIVFSEISIYLSAFIPFLNEFKKTRILRFNFSFNFQIFNLPICFYFFAFFFFLMWWKFRIEY